LKNKIITNIKKFFEMSYHLSSRLPIFVVGEKRVWNPNLFCEIAT